MANANNTQEIQHINGTIGFELPEDGMYDFQPGEPIQIIHDGPVEVTTLSGEHKTIGADEKLGTITPMTRKALNSMNRALEQQSFNLFVDGDSNVTFSGGHLPTGTVMNGSRLELGKSASAQHVELDNQADINWQNGVIRETVLDHATNGKDDMSTGGGYLTKSTFKNGTEIGMMDNHISQSTFDNAIVGHTTAKNVHFKDAKTVKPSKNKPTLMNADLKNARITTGTDSNFIGVTGHNDTIDSKLANAFDNVELNAVNFTEDNKNVKAKSGYTLANTKVSDVISTTPFTASDSELHGSPWHPIMVNTPIDVAETTMKTKKGIIIDTPDHSTLGFNNVGKTKKPVTIDDNVVNHGLTGFKVNDDNPAFTAAAKMDTGFYGNPVTRKVDAATIQKAADTATKKPKAVAKMAPMGKMTAIGGKSVDNGPEL